MKQYLFAIGIAIVLSFSIAGCGQDTAEKKEMAPASALKEVSQAVEKGVKKSEETMKEAKETVTQTVEEGVEETRETVETTKKKAAQTVENTAQAVSEAAESSAAAVSGESSAFPDVIEMKNTGAFETHYQAIVMFSHKKHAAPDPDGYGIGCGQCHHDKDGQPLTELEKGDAVQGCLECHDKTGVGRKPREMSREEWETKQLAYYYGAIHVNCVDCHKKHKGAPVKCTDCHPRPEK